jgi:hypothetical protein
LQASIDVRDRKAVATAETIGRLQRENARLLGELANWQKHGQLRDPATGRLIPRVKAADHV